MRYLTKKEKLSRFLIRERVRRGLSQQELADKIEASLRNYQRWESGAAFPQPYFWEKLEGFFGESINEAVKSDGIEEASQNQPPQEKQDYRSSSETDEGEVGTANYEPRMSPISQRGLKHPLIVASTILLVLILVGIGFLITRSLHPAAIKPGGSWISPTGKTVSDVITFAAYAYPTHSGAPEIDHVNFTVYWQGVDPRTWIIACVARKPVRNDVYACQANLRHLGAPAGQIKVSFDVYDRQGNVNLAPNGEHTLIYSPATRRATNGTYLLLDSTMA